MTLLEPIPMKYRADVLQYPRGWYCVAESSDVTPDTLLPASWLGEQLVVYRTEDGRAQVADAYCPHLGAHLASHDGRICDGRLVCPFHKWEFDAATGMVAHIPYTNVLPPASVKLTLHPTREINGMVLMWYDEQGRAPDFEPYNAEALDRPGYVLFDVKTWETTCPFRDILENLFDTAHIQQLHNSNNLPDVLGSSREPYGLRVDYRMQGEELPIEGMTVHLSGVSLLHQEFRGPGWSTLFVHSFTPVDNERFIQKTRLYLAEMPDPAMYELIGKAWVERFVYEVEQDLKVLDFKKHLSRPRLCAGDGPIMEFRRYASGFYS